MYPLKMIPLYHERIWGGNKLNKIFGRLLPNDKIGESWELCSHKNGMSIVANGDFAGKSIEDLIKIYKEDLLGKRNVPGSTVFPIMVKIIDANDNLSIQVHPDDQYAYHVEHEPGKTEAWYIVAAKENAQIVYGLKENISKEDFIQAVQDKTVQDTLRYVSVKTGDMVFVPAGTVHALLNGVVVYEVQQNSDTTYRVYDFDRMDAAGKGRDLHIDKAIQVISFGSQCSIDFQRTVIDCPYFRMEKISVADHLVEETSGTCIIYCIVSGRGELVFEDQVLPLAPGETVLIPACIDTVMLIGQMSLLKIQ